MDEITIPADVTPENVPTQIVDFSRIKNSENKKIIIVEDQDMDDARDEIEKVR